MKYAKIWAVAAAIIAILVISAPVSAGPVLPPPIIPPVTYSVQGIEIFPGYDSGGNNYGATFIAQVTGSAYKLCLGASINYQGTDPTPNGTNAFIGGSWSLTATSSGRCVGFVSGKIPTSGGSVAWSNDGDANTGPNNGTEIGTVSTPLTVVCATGVFSGITGGSFTGTDNHVSGISIGQTVIPAINGSLNLT